MENKYLFELEELDNDERREARRLNRIKKKRRAWAALIVAVCIVAAGVVGTLLWAGRTGNTSPIQVVSVEVMTESSEKIESAIDSLSDTEGEVVVTPPEPVVVEPTEDELFEEAVRNFVNTMTTETKVAGIFVVTPESLTNVATVTRAGDGTKTAIEKYPVGGIVYSEKNMTSQEQFMEVISNTKSFAKYPTFFALDEELGNSSFSSVMKNDKTMKPCEIAELSDAAIAYTQEEKIASYMAGLGLNLNLGIVADVAKTEDSAMKEKSFGADVDLAAQMTAKCVEVLDVYNVNSALKYFPGQGLSNQLPEVGRSVSSVTRADFDSDDLKTFTAGIDAGADILIISHTVAADLTGEEVRCSASKYVMTELLRKELGYDDLVIMTDSLSKDAVASYEESAEACISSIKAGADMVLCPEKFEEAYYGVLEAVNTGVIAKERIEDSLVRIYKVKFKGLSPEEISAMTPQTAETQETTEQQAE